MFDNHVRKAEHRIVSIFKPYLRTIVRGKEKNPIQFGMKTHQIRVAGFNFVEYTRFGAYNEATRLQLTLDLHHDLIGVACKRAAFDQLCSTNEDSNPMIKKRILTNFSQKGRVSTKASETVQKIKQQPGKERATVLEGSFGNEKNHYGLRKIKARSAETAQIWMFFWRDDC